MLENLEFSSPDWIFILPLAFMAIDCVLGFSLAIKNKTLSSSKMFNGFFKKVANMSVVIIAALLVMAFSLPEQVCGAASIYICTMELTSVLTNLKKYGIDISKKKEGP